MDGVNRMTIKSAGYQVRCSKCGDYISTESVYSKQVDGKWQHEQCPKI